jgi:phospholipase/carboxylesterase
MTTLTELSHLHRFVPPAISGKPAILLLHGTGGDENDLLPFGHAVAPGSALLSPRGKVTEAGMPRFFRRLQEGIFDEDDVRRRADELADFVNEARDTYRLGAPIAVGFSNGANIAATVLQLRPDVLAGAVLLRAMVPLKHPPRADLNGAPVLIVSGATDPIVPAENAAHLAAMLTRAGAMVEHRTLPVGHNLSQADILITKTWLEER